MEAFDELKLICLKIIHFLIFYLLDVRRVVPLEILGDALEVLNYLPVSSHVSSQDQVDDSLSNLLELCLVHISKYIGLWLSVESQ